MSPVAQLCAAEQLLHVEADVTRDLPQQRWRHTSPWMEGNGRRAPVRMPVLPMGTALSHLDKAQRLPEPRYFARLQDRDRAHYATLTVWIPTNSDSSFGLPSSRSMPTTS